MSHSQDAYYNSLSANTTRPPDETPSPEQLRELLDIAMGRPVGADIHKRYEYTDRRINPAMSCNNEGHEERMKYHMQRVAGNI